jgi:predicted secreted Zn-dependent protease
VPPFTSTQCLAIAERKIVEALEDRRHGKELKLTAQAWVILAEKVRQGEEIQKQVEALKAAKLAPDIASTAASSDCGSLKQIADDIRAFHLTHPAS